MPRPLSDWLHTPVVVPTSDTKADKIDKLTQHTKSVTLNPRRCTVSECDELLDPRTSVLRVLPDKTIGRICPSCDSQLRTRSGSSE
jgi:hypothetical protein